MLIYSVLARRAQFFETEKENINHLNHFDMILKLKTRRIKKASVMAEATEYLRQNNIKAEVAAAYPDTYTKNMWFVYAY